MNKEVLKRLKSIKKSIKNQNISYDEIFYLENHHAEIIELDDIELGQWGGISEEEWQEVI